MSLIVANIRFSFLATKLRCFELITKKECFSFFVTETRSTQLYSTKNMFWFACCNIGLFSVLLHQKKGFFQYAASHSNFSLDFTQTTVLLSFGEVTLFQNRLSEDNLLFCFRNQTTLWKLHITEKMFWFVGKWIRLSLALCHKKERFFLFVFKIRWV